MPAAVAGLEHMFCIARTKGLVYVHIDANQPSENKVHFDALTNASLLCAELLEANPLKRFVVPYYAVWRERMLHNFHLGEADVENFILEEALEEYNELDHAVMVRSSIVTIINGAMSLLRIIVAILVMIYNMF